MEMDERDFDLFDPSNIFFDDDAASTSSAASSGNSSSSTPEVWIFGYGSLLWYPNFQYTKCLSGHIRGFNRRFWQGNVTHRGTVGKPGRVCTLVEDEKGITWGCAFKIAGNTALEYLKHRECTLGGYITLFTKFFPRHASEDSGFSGETFPVLIYIATPSNEHWLGPANEATIAAQIAESSGPSGHNVEYLVRLAMFMREAVPDAEDQHLFTLERLVKEHLTQRRIPLSSLLGATPARIRRDSHEERRQLVSFEHTSRVASTKLRCLNI